VATTAILAILLVALSLLRTKYGWPADASQNTVLIGILILSLLPILLALLDIIIERGAVIELKGIKVDFSHGRDTGTVGITVATNIGVRGKIVTDSESDQILGTLAEATSGEVAVIDLEDGQAWWETRLLVLLAGAERLGKPEIIVFVGTDATKEHQYQGWGRARDLLPHLVNADPQYKRSLQASRAAALQWALVEPNAAPNIAPPVPAAPTWITGHLAKTHLWGFDATGLHNELYAERLLQSELGEKVEGGPQGARRISIMRLQQLFRPVLLKEHIDLSWPAERQLTEFLDTRADNLAITRDGKYESLVPKLTLITEALKSVSKDR
jgi:hypothetical protein